MPISRFIEGLNVYKKKYLQLYATKKVQRECIKLRRQQATLLECMDYQNIALERAYISMRRMRWHEGSTHQQATLSFIQKTFTDIKSIQKTDC